MLGTLRRTVTQTLGEVVVLIPVVIAAAVLVGLSKGLRAAGLSRQVAGITTTVVVVALSLYMLYLFATRVIDW